MTLWINHLCCSDCLHDARQALAALPGIDAASAKRSQTAADARASGPEHGWPPPVRKLHRLDVSDLEKVDFVALDKALREQGLVAGRMELSGIAHFRLAAKVEHLCCGMCARSTQERVGFLKARAQSGQLRWLDSVSVDAKAKTIIADARYLQAGKSVDVTEFLGALNDIGYAPQSVQVLVHEETKFVSQNREEQRSPLEMLATAEN